MSVFQRGGKNSYYYEFVYKGVQYGPTSTGTTDKREAKRIEGEVRAKAEADHKLRVANAGNPVGFRAVVDRYLADVCKSGKVVNTADRKHDLDRLVEFFGADRSVLDFSTADLERAIEWRQSHRKWEGRKQQSAELVSNATVNRTVTMALSAVFTHAETKWNMVFPHKPNWFDHILKETKIRVRELTDREDAALTAAMDSDYNVVRQFSLLSGLRKNESLLRWNEVNLTTNIIRCTGKGDADLVIGITPKMRRIIEAQIGLDPEWVFTFKARRNQNHLRNGERVFFEQGVRYPITYGGLDIEWKRARAKAVVACPSLADYRWHDNRHTFASRLLRHSNGDITAVQKAMNHKDLRSTQRYAHMHRAEVTAKVAAAEQAEAQRQLAVPALPAPSQEVMTPAELLRSLPGEQLTALLIEALQHQSLSTVAKKVA